MADGRGGERHVERERERSPLEEVICRVGAGEMMDEKRGEKKKKKTPFPANCLYIQTRGAEG